MKTVRILFACLSVALLNAVPCFGAFVHDYFTEFSQANGNPNGVWAYQSVVTANANSTATNMATPDNCCGGGFWQSTSGDTFSVDGQTIFHPGDSHDSLVGFIFPDAVTETVHVAITVGAAASGSQDGRIVNFWLNDTKLAGPGDIFIADNTSHPFSFDQVMSPGDKFFLRVNKAGANNFGDSTQLSATFSAVPEPGSLVLFGLGAVGLSLAARSRRKA